MTTNQQLRNLFKTELGLKSTQNIRSIMKVLNIETKEECYEVMALMYAESVRPIEKLVVINRFDDLPIELKALIKSYLPPNPIIKAIKEIFSLESKLRFYDLKLRNKKLDEKRNHRYSYFIKKHPIDYVIKNLRELEKKRKVELDEQQTLSVMNQGKARDNACIERRETFLRTHYYKREPWKPTGICLLATIKK